MTGCVVGSCVEQFRRASPDVVAKSLRCKVPRFRRSIEKARGAPYRSSYQTSLPSAGAGRPWDGLGRAVSAVVRCIASPEPPRNAVAPAASETLSGTSSDSAHSYRYVLLWKDLGHVPCSQRWGSLSLSTVRLGILPPPSHSSWLLSALEPVTVHSRFGT